ncbi:MULTISPECIES: NAD-dependent epimerase/dehydratase family protein [unclassified Mesorhizobium]|uniref:NAD-dependent epimerase/dehydratase family protein n=1 Tax=unclassified Mesorhizobium TaxID=325217 RepID=UPI0003CFD9E2|nr:MULTISPECIES: NAD-dependent epimerase/dehydratase family protein [unclassified Mesorhizobium]ESZ19158.1 epimerase [Mesorhizobium sp. L48C026A00]RWN54315.1 MAG: NAD-dependent epimerase/dehydratase family protein [Mesorhizobium sp.]RWN79416.1 MAG: NAD-dependent epimerase/dehydratase family protein [Mesorhizobium sp.]RWN84974.1 MAG: NAD-dependent epimerase/dehydratase family protein [Mesorhizobium sp.]RWN93092.1 MAG: NAD-dependent epimerase/dehydratase family protein [Mesorhizobium sp.]
MMQSILVTGGAGNIGSALTRALVKLPQTQVVVADNLSTGSRDKVQIDAGNLTVVKADVNDFDDISSLFYRFHFTHVFHFAAVVGVQRTLANPLLVLRDITGIENVLRLCKNTGAERVYFASSSEVYGEPFEIPQNESTTPLNSRLPYAVVKNLGEVYLRTFQREFGLPFTIFRFFNTYGPRQSEDFVLPRFVRAAQRGEPLTIYGDGSQTRTFCYVDDTVDACVAVHRTRAHENEVINVGSDVEMSILQLAEFVIEVLGSSSKLEFRPPLAEGDMTRRCPDTNKMKAILNRPLVPLEEGIRRLADHLSRPEDRPALRRVA